MMLKNYLMVLSINVLSAKSYGMDALWDGLRDTSYAIGNAWDNATDAVRDAWDNSDKNFERNAKELNLSKNKNTSDILEALKTSRKNKENVTSLNLRGCEVGNRGISYYFCMESQDPELIFREINKISNLSVLDLSYNDLNDDLIKNEKVLVNLSFKPLKHLDLSHNNLGESVDLFATFCPKSLEYLNLSHNKLDLFAIDSLLKIRKAPQLSLTLDITGNPGCKKLTNVDELKRQLMKKQITLLF